MSTLMTLFSRASRETKEAFVRRLRPYGVHAGQHFLLELLWNAHEDLTIGEIATRLAVEDPSITRTVQRMERQGLVKKYSHPTDARQVVVKLTQKGWDLQAVIPPLLAAGEERILANVSDVERALFMRVLQQMLLNVEHDASDS
jgi:DNA-binding MarR family transcriptional regulator